jgi:hypothetical protein
VCSFAYLIITFFSKDVFNKDTVVANGNILSLKRNAALRTFVPQAGSSMGGGTTPQTSTELDKLAYKYTATVTDHYGIVRKTNNRLSQVVDTAYSEGLGDIFTQTSGNYEYDEKGRLTRDLKNDIEKIEWTAYDKVKKITRTSGSTLPDIEYTYDSRQQRLTKKLVYATAALNETTIYVYDAAGVLMAAYTQYFDAATNTLKVRLDEEYMYGLSRVGVYKPATVRGPLTLSQLRFELTDHLGNVRAVVSGQKKVNNDANILSLSDYYSGGMEIPGRTFVSEEYRYSYQGSEKEQTLWSGKGITTDFRMLDTRLMRWISTDMIAQPWQSPFTSMDNDPVNLTDIMGLQAQGGGGTKNPDGTVGESPLFDGVGGGTGSSTGDVPCPTFDGSTVKSGSDFNFSNIGPGIQEVIMKGLVTFAGFADGAKTAFSFGLLPLKDPNRFGEYAEDAAKGQVLGQIIPMLGSVRQAPANGSPSLVPAGGGPTIPAVSPKQVPAVQIRTAQDNVLNAKNTNDQVHKQPRNNAVNEVMPLPKIDATGKVHGILPKVKDLGKYSKEELRVLLEELKQSVQRRIEVTSKMGRDRAHGQRQGAEQDLIKSLEKYLGQ